MSEKLSVVDRLRALPTASVSDALDALKINGQLPGISRRTTGKVIAGEAFTVSYEPTDEDGGTVGDFLDDVAEGQVVVIANEGRAECTTWGGIMSRTAAVRGVAGTIVHGSCRDIGTSERVDYPIWSSSVYMRTGKDRVRCAGVQSQIVVSGVHIDSGDYVLADADGVLVVPRGRIAEVLEIAESIEHVESSIAEATSGGMSLAQARRQFAYHSLQAVRQS